MLFVNWTRNVFVKSILKFTKKSSLKNWNFTSGGRHFCLILSHNSNKTKAVNGCYIKPFIISTWSSKTWNIGLGYSKIVFSLKYPAQRVKELQHMLKYLIFINFGAFDLHKLNSYKALCQCQKFQTMVLAVTESITIQTNFIQKFVFSG